MKIQTIGYLLSTISFAYLWLKKHFDLADGESWKYGTIGAEAFWVFGFFGILLILVGFIIDRKNSH
jgi:hypothetical protein